jgi:aminoglycoside phosphotransferase (APT) family kinase protein
VRLTPWQRGLHPLLDDRLVTEAVLQASSRLPSRLNQLPAKPPRVVYEAFFDGGSPLIFKAEVGTPGHDHEIALEGWALEQARLAGMAVPEVLAADSSETSFPFRYLVMSRVEGVVLKEANLTEAQRTLILAEAADQISRLHQVEARGYGPLDDAVFLREGEVRGKWLDWREATLGAGSETLGLLVEHGLLDGPQRDFLSQVLGAEMPQHPTSVLLHGDFGLNQIMVKDGHLAALIDFGDRESGPPEWDFATVWLWDEPVVEDLANAYEEAAGFQLNREVIPQYALAKLLQIVRRRLIRRTFDDAAQKATELKRFL